MASQRFQAAMPLTAKTPLATRCSNRTSVSASSRVRASASEAASTPPAPEDEGSFEWFEWASRQGNLVPVYSRVFGDQLTPVLAYRCLVAEDDRAAPSFLFESVTGGTQQGRWSYVGAQPRREVLARGQKVTYLDHGALQRTHAELADPLAALAAESASWRPVRARGLPPGIFSGGWVGYAGYDTVRYGYLEKLAFQAAPEDDRGLPDLHLALYEDVVVFDHATKLVYAVTWVDLDEFGVEDEGSDESERGGKENQGSDHDAASSIDAPPRRRAALYEAWEEGLGRLEALVSRLSPRRAPVLPAGSVGGLQLEEAPDPSNLRSDMGRDGYVARVRLAQEHMRAGDVFQLVLSQRFVRRTFADPFEIYRALRVVNPSPYMVYLQARGAILVASSPEILCRVGEDGLVTNRPLAGTRRRGADEAQDAALEEELKADAKERAEHVMLVDLGRNDVGRVSRQGSVCVESLMDVERYSHVMHLSSTVTGRLRANTTAWDALRAALPAGTVSGAPKVRAMQLIDELETKRRGPYGGGIGAVAFTGGLDMALALRTMVVPTAQDDALYAGAGGARPPRREWEIHIQAGAGVVADSVPDAEHQECVNKAAGLSRAVDLAEAAFVDAQEQEEDDWSDEEGWSDEANKV